MVESYDSLPMAHREYEKVLRQLEAECRTHIKCEQQMKLHIECLQEKMEQVQKDHEKEKKELDEKLNKIKENSQKEVKLYKDNIQKLEKEVLKISESQARIEKAKNEAVNELR